MKKIFFCVCAAVATTLTSSVSAQDLTCYMTNAQGETINLAYLCSSSEPGRIIRVGNVPGVLNRRNEPLPRPASNSGNATAGRSVSSGSGSAGSGNCNTPGQRDARGNRCGGRSAASRPGGR